MASVCLEWSVCGLLRHVGLVGLEWSVCGLLRHVGLVVCVPVALVWCPLVRNGIVWSAVVRFGLHRLPETWD